MIVFQIILLYLIVGVVIAFALSKNGFFGTEISTEVRKKIYNPENSKWTDVVKKYDLKNDYCKEDFLNETHDLFIIMGYTTCIIGWVYIVPKSVILSIIERHKDKVGIMNAFDTFAEMRDTYDEDDWEAFHYYMSENHIEYNWEKHRYYLDKEDLYYAMKYVNECRKYREEA